MKTSPVSPNDLSRSVIAVPPLCRNADESIAEASNRALLGHIRRGGISTFLYGGNANLFNSSLADFTSMLDRIEGLAHAGDWMIPSVGADYGKATDQIDILREREFPTAMLLPLRFATTATGVAVGIARLAARYHRPLIVYIRDRDYVAPSDLARLIADGAVCAVKYAATSAEPAEDAYLGGILEQVPLERVASGVGERPVVTYRKRFGLTNFTSGSGCIAPHTSERLRQALAAGRLAEAERLRLAMMPFEDLRDRHSPIFVLHEAVALAGIATTGPLLPFLANISAPSLLEEIGATAHRLLDYDLAPLVAAH